MLVLVDWPVYPRLRRTMLTSSWSRSLALSIRAWPADQQGWLRTDKPHLADAGLASEAPNAATGFLETRAIRGAAGERKPDGVSREA
jgi:hypothetical protein